jgi:LysR family transcriptional regulator, benzoate and cis,cis-muconate-responsive activator of ben and cat genes
MDFRHVHAFIAIAEDLSLRKAARRLGISQPALSRQVQQLEQEIGLTLFVRHPGGIELTHHGTLMLDQARRLSEAAVEFADHVRTAKSHTRGSLRIGIGWGLWNTVNRILVHHAAAMPGVAVVGADIVSSAQIEALRHRRIDVGLARPPLDTREMRCETLFHESVVAVLPAGHPLAGRAAVRLADVAGERLLLHDRDLAPGIYDKIFELYAAAGIAPHIVPTSASPASAGGMIQVASGKGIFIGLGSLISFADTPGIVMVPLDEPAALLPVCMVWRASESSPVVLQFIESVRELFRRTAGGRRRASPRRPARRRARTARRASA